MKNAAANSGTFGKNGSIRVAGAAVRPALVGLASALMIATLTYPVAHASASDSPLDRTNTLLNRGTGNSNQATPGISGVRPRAPGPIRSIVPNARRGAAANAQPVQSGIRDVPTRTGRVRVISPDIAERYGITADTHARNTHTDTRGGTRVSVGTSGVSAKGSIDGDDFRLIFSLGNDQYFVPGTGLISIQGSRSHDGTFWGGATRTSFGHSSFSTGTSWHNRCPGGQCSTVIVQSPAFVDPTWIESAIPRSHLETALQQPAPEPTTFDLARDSLFAGSWQAADSLILSHLEQFPDDADALRLLAITRFETGRHDDAIALMTSAYERAPYLAATPLLADEFAGGDRAMRQRVRNAVSFAHRRDTASAWLFVAVLMQAEGESRYQVAGNMLVRAAERGLDTTIVKLMAEALGLRPARINPILEARGENDTATLTSNPFDPTNEPGQASTHTAEASSNIDD